MTERMPGEHDASLDRGEAYQEFFGDLHYTFDHNGVHFIEAEAPRLSTSSRNFRSRGGDL